MFGLQKAVDIIAVAQNRNQKTEHHKIRGEWWTIQI